MTRDELYDKLDIVDTDEVDTVLDYLRDNCDMSEASDIICS